MFAGLIDQIEFLREEIKAKNIIIDHLFTLKLSLRDEECSNLKALIKLITKLSNDLNENIINIFDELNNPSTLKDDFKKPCNKAFIDNNSESIIDFNNDPQFNRLT